MVNTTDQRPGHNQNGPDWTYGVFGCFGNPVLCVATFVVPCVTFGLVVDDFAEKNCCLYGWLYLIPGLNCYMQAQQRGDIRDKRAITGTFSNDFCWVFWCTLCTLVQQTREIVEMKSEETELENQLSKQTSRPPSHQRQSSPSSHQQQSSRYVAEPSHVRTSQPRPTQSLYAIDISPPTKSTEEVVGERIHHDYDYPAEPGQKSPAGYVNMRYETDSEAESRPADRNTTYYDMNRPSVYVSSDRPTSEHQQQQDSDYVNEAYDYEPVNVQDVSYNVI